MSRKVTFGARAGTGTTGSGGVAVLDADDMCPVCKTIRYLNKDMEFLINPECYHSMCVNCVNRLFNDGPNQCPYATCNRTLRRKGFRKAFFGDLSVEREVDIRRRVAAVFNKTEDDFDTLQNYNDYLDKVECLTFDLVNGPEDARRKAEAELLDWEAANKADIERNRKAGRQADEAERRRMDAEREAARQRRLDAIREIEEEKIERARSREAELDSLASGEVSGASIQRVQLKRRVNKNAVAAAVAANAATTNTSSSTTSAPGSLGMSFNTATAADQVGRLSIQGLKEKRKAPEPQGPYDPFGGMDFTPSRYKLHAGLSHPKVDRYRQDRQFTVGGYDFDEYTARAMFEAFSGLGVFIEDEKEVGAIGLSAGEVATIGAGMAAAGGDRMELD